MEMYDIGQKIFEVGQDKQEKTMDPTSGRAS